MHKLFVPKRIMTLTQNIADLVDYLNRWQDLEIKLSKIKEAGLSHCRL